MLTGLFQYTSYFSQFGLGPKLSLLQYAFLFDRSAN